MLRELFRLMPCPTYHSIAAHSEGVFRARLYHEYQLPVTVCALTATESWSPGSSSSTSQLGHCDDNFRSCPRAAAAAGGPARGQRPKL